MKLFLRSCVLMLVCFSSSAFADELFPFVNDEPKIKGKLNQANFDFILQTLQSGKLGPHMDCELKITTKKNLRKFSDHEEWVEYIQVDFKSGIPIVGDLKFKFTKDANFGKKQSANKWNGIGEDFRIEVGDYYDHWLRFIHDGRGHLDYLVMGNSLRTVPCKVRD